MNDQSRLAPPLLSLMPLLFRISNLSIIPWRLRVKCNSESTLINCQISRCFCKLWYNLHYATCETLQDFVRMLSNYVGAIPVTEIVPLHLSLPLTAPAMLAYVVTLRQDCRNGPLHSFCWSACIKYAFSVRNLDSACCEDYMQMLKSVIVSSYTLDQSSTRKKETILIFSYCYKHTINI